MQNKELIALIENIISIKSETKNIEIKKAKDGVPENLYDTFSSFSNTSGGVIIFGIDEKDNYNVCGISNPDNFQKKITEQSLMMEPKIRPIITICDYNGKTVAACEIPELDVFSKPCYYMGKGKMKGSYIRVGDADLPMTDYEIYSFDAFKYKTEDELRSKNRIGIDILNDISINNFIEKITSLKPNLNNLDKAKKVFIKNTFPSLELANYLKDKDYDSVELCGLVSNICVLSNAVMVKSALPNAKIFIDKSATDSFDKELEQKAFDVLKGLHIEII